MVIKGHLYLLRHVIDNAKYDFNEFDNHDNMIMTSMDAVVCGEFAFAVHSVIMYYRILCI